MGLIKKSTELIIPQTVKMMIYGQPGMGKTTLALSAPKPLLLDFDNGVKRVNMSHLEGVDTVQVTNWSEIQQVLSEDLRAYQTIVVDTVGKMMDFIISYRCGGRNPRIQDWGIINNDFKWFTNELSMLNKHIIFVAHRDTRKDGDDTVFIPTLREKNYNSIITEIDLLGYLEMRNVNGIQQRTITFDPTSRNDGKNTCNLPGIMNIFNIIDQNGQPTSKNDFISSSVIIPYHNMIDAKEEKQKEYTEKLNEIKESIQLMTDAQGANNFLSHIKEYDIPGTSIIQQARTLFSDKVKELGLVYNKENKQYIDKNEAA